MFKMSDMQMPAASFASLVSLSIMQQVLWVSCSWHFQQGLASAFIYLNDLNQLFATLGTQVLVSAM